jgi:PIN domain nuclease of toxin-antitoxin system
VQVLLDIHAFIWWNQNDPRLSPVARRCIDDDDNEVLLSVASAWEIAIKAALGKLQIPEPADRYVPSRLAHYHFNLLSITLEHALAVYHLPLLHRDPFDRLLVVQSQLEGLPLVTADAAITQYGVAAVW